MHGQLRAPEAAHPRLVEAHILRRHDRLERIVNVGVPRAFEETPLLAAFVVWDRCPKPHVPSVASVLHQTPVEASGHGCRHGLEILVVDAPVQPAHLDSLDPALLNDLQQRGNGRDAAGMVMVLGVHKEVLHVDDHKEGLCGIDGTAAVIADTVVGIENEFACGAARQVETLGGDVVIPLVIAAEGYMVVQIVLDGRVDDFLGKGVDVFDLDGGWGHSIGKGRKGKKWLVSCERQCNGTMNAEEVG